MSGDEEKTGPPVYVYRQKYSRKDHRKAVSLKPRRSRWSLLGYVIVFVALFWFFHAVLHVG